MEEFWKAMLDIALKVGSYISGVNSTRETNATNLKIARETNEAQTEIHREDNAFNAAEAEKAREYNSIGSQLERGREAGVSDWFTIGQPSSSAVSASASNMPGSVVPQMQNPFAQIGSSPLDLAGSLKNLADAKKAGAETTDIETLLGLKVDQAKENIIRDRLQNELTRLYGANIQEQTLNKIVADTAHLEALAREAHANADFILERKVLTQLEQVTERYKAKLTRTQYNIAKEDLKTYRERLDADLAVKTSEAYRNRQEGNKAPSEIERNESQRDLNIANSNTIEQMRDALVREANANADITEAQRKHIDDVILAEINELKGRYAVSTEQANQLRELSKKIHKETKYYEVKMALDEMNEVFRTIRLGRRFR